MKPIKGEDELETVEQLRDFLDEHPPAALAEPAGHGAGRRWRLTRADLAEVRALRETVRAVLERANTDAVEAAALINDGLRRSRATPALRHDHDRWRTEITSDTDRCSAHLAATTLSALASVIATLGPARLGVCAGPACRATFRGPLAQWVEAILHTNLRTPGQRHGLPEPAKRAWSPGTAGAGVPCPGDR